MRSWTLAVACAAVTAFGVGCARSKSEAPAAPAPAATTAQRPVGGPPGGAQPGAPRRAPQPPNWERQDSVRRALVAEVLTSIAGRENEPAGKVFKNVKVNRDMPAKAFLTMMDEQYGRSISASCTGCHASTNVGGVLKVNWADEEPKKKKIARQMEVMTQSMNRDLAKVKELDADYPKATCVMCHRGAEHMPNTMNARKNSDPPPPSRK
jgi:Photosynthetic reaction centre cytochrome C subunit